MFQTIELFLVKEVDYVVSDRKVPTKDKSNTNTPGTATPSPSPSPAFLSSPADGGVPKKSVSVLNRLIINYKTNMYTVVEEKFMFVTGLNCFFILENKNTLL